MFRKIGKTGIWAISLGVVLAATAQAVTVGVLDEGAEYGGAPTVGIDDMGNALVAWGYHLLGPGELYFARYDITEGWGPKTLIDTSAIGERVHGYILAVNEDGIALLAWTGHDGLYATTFLPGSGWQPPKVIDSGPNPFLVYAEFLELGIDSAGNGLLVWRGHANGSKVFSSQYTLSTDTWTEPEIVVNQSTTYSLAVSANGSAVLLWRKWENDGNYTVFASHFIPGIGWQDPVAVYLSYNPDFHVAINDSGEAMAVFNGNGEIYADRFIPGQGWQPAEKITVDDPWEHFNPKVALNSSGDAIVAWEQSNYGLYANSYLSGEGWQGVVVLRESGAGGPWLPPPHISDNGNIVVLWHPEAFDALAEVEMKRFYPAQGWLDTEGLSCIGSKGKLYDFSFAINSSDKSVIAWTEGTDILGGYGLADPIDSDRDGLPDDWEREYFGDLSQGTSGDYDEDGLTNLMEYLTGADPTNPDTDSDGLPDGWEVYHGLDPTNPDSDFDGMPDGWEVQYMLDPLDPSDADEDPDGDGLTNLKEYQAGTYPWNPDSDFDGMPDGWEVQYGLNPMDPSDADKDSDGDGLNNLGEYEQGTDPTNPDTDSDGMADGWEVQYGLNPLDPSDADEDPDGDGLTNLKEYQLGTNPTNSDTDTDGMPDGWEVQYGLNPLDPSDADKDSDGDGLNNLGEYQQGTDPTNPDTDADEMPDGWEVQYGLNPLDPSDADEDPDGDGLTNLQEYLFGTDPTEPFNDCALLSPNGGEVIPSGTNYTIWWGAPPEAVSLKLMYSVNNGKKWKLIAEDLTGNDYDWQVPIPPKTKKKCVVKVIGYDGSDAKVGSDKSDAPFTIAVVKVTLPNGGETLLSGTPYTIEWETYGTKNPVAKVILKYTTNAGKKWKKIDTLAENTGTHDWTVPDVPKTKTKCKVKVVLKGENGKKFGSDTSDGYFTIEP